MEVFINNTVLQSIPPYVNCTNLTDSQLKTLPLARSITAAICCTLGLVILLLIYCRKTWQTRQQRFFLYLTISAVFYLLTLVMQIEHYFDYPMRKNWQDKLCDTVGYLSELTRLIQLVFMFGVILQLFVAYYGLLFDGSVLQCYVPCRKCVPGQTCRFLCPEITFLFLSLITAVLVTIPWLLTPYGESGPWCWIRTISIQCSESDRGFWEQMGMWYIPYAIVSLCSIVFIIFSLVSCTHGLLMARQQVSSVATYTAIIAGILLISAFLCGVEMACNIIAPKVDSYWVWILYAILPPISAVVIPMVLLVIHGPEMVRATVSFCCCVQHGVNNDTVYTPQPDNSSLPDRLVHPHDYSQWVPVPGPQKESDLSVTCTDVATEFPIS